MGGKFFPVIWNWLVVCFIFTLLNFTRSFSQSASSEEENEEWRPPEPKSKAPSKTTRDTAMGELKATAKRTGNTKEPKAPKQPKAPKLPKDPKPSASCRPAAVRKTQVAKVLKDSSASGLARTKRKKTEVTKDEAQKQTDCPERERAEESKPNIRMKEEVRHIYIYTNQPEILQFVINNVLIIIQFGGFCSRFCRGSRLLCQMLIRQTDGQVKGHHILCSEQRKRK